MTTNVRRLQAVFKQSGVGGYFIPLIIVGAALFVLAMEFDSVMRYERDSILSYQWWRLVTGHVTHLGWRHFLLNVVALGMIWFLFFNHVTVWLQSLICISLALLVSFQLLLLSPDVEWYVGLSGILHGLCVVGCVSWCRQKRPLGFILLLLLLMKITVEQTQGLTNNLLDDEGPVLVVAHLYGVVAALLIVFAQMLIGKLKPTPQGPP